MTIKDLEGNLTKLELLEGKLVIDGRIEITIPRPSQAQSLELKNSYMTKATLNSQQDGSHRPHSADLRWNYLIS